MILYSPSCQRYYRVIEETGCWRFLPTKQAQAELLMAAWQRAVQAPRGPQVKRHRIAAQHGFPLRHTDQTTNRRRATRVACILFG